MVFHFLSFCQLTDLRVNYSHSLLSQAVQPCVFIIVAAFKQCLHCLYISHLARDDQCSACTVYVMLKLFSSCQYSSAVIPLLVSHCRALNTPLGCTLEFLRHTSRKYLSKMTFSLHYNRRFMLTWAPRSRSS